MAQDARFEDAPFTDQPLRLRAETPEDLEVVSSLLQDSLARVGDIAWMPGRRRLAMVLNRFRWEDREAAERGARRYERVRTAVTFDGVSCVKARGVPPTEKDLVISVLAIGFEPGEDGAGRILLNLSGDGDLALEVECIEATLTDLTKPWEARSEKAPAHEA